MRSRNLSWVVVSALVAVGVVAAGVHYSGSDAASAAATSPSTSIADDLAAFALPPPTGSLTPPVGTVGRSQARGSLVAEINSIRALISDTNGPLDRGTASLALWASANLDWAELKALPSTTPALFRKDPDQERGHAICIEGVIQEIHAEKNLSRRLISDRAAPLVESPAGAGAPVRPAIGAGPQLMNPADMDRADAGEALRPLLAGGDEADWAVPGGKIFFATIAEPDRGRTEEARLRAKPFVVEAIAVKSTGALVDGDSAHFCGILTGIVLAGNDSRLEHRAVGMFDLPENTGGPAHLPSPAASAVP